MIGFHRRGRGRRPGLASHSTKLRRRVCFETLESRQLLSITLPTLADQTLLAGAPLSVALDVSGTSGTVGYTVSVSNSSLTNATVSNPQLAVVVPTGNPSLRLTVDDDADGIHGDLVFELFDDLAPETVSRIIGLVNDTSIRGVPYYEGLTFHRVIDGFMIQGGDPNGDGTGGPGFQFDDEFNAALQFTGPGLLAMANSGRDTNGSQFFVTVEPYRSGDFQYTIFGMLTEGSDILQQINAVATDSNDRPVNDVAITSASIFYDTQNAMFRISAPDGTTGSADVTVTATDNITSESTSQTFHLTVAADTTNDPPFLGSISPIVTTADTPVAFDIPATDVEGDAMYFDGYVLPDNSNPDLTLSIDNSTGHATLTPTNGITGVYSVALGVESPNSGVWDSQAVPVYINPAAPSGVTLLAASDTGSSDLDGLTNLDNSNGKTLQFQVDGVLAGATIRLYADNVLIGQATATDTSVIVTTNGTVTLTDGAHSITATQTLVDQAVNVGNLHAAVDLASETSSPLAISIDTTAPQFNFTAITGAAVGVPYACQAATDENPGSGVTYQLLESPTGMIIDAGSGLLTWLPGEGQDGAVPVTVEAADAAGNTIQQTYSINVLAANAAPVLDPANPSMIATDENTATTIDLATLINNGVGTTTVTDADDNALLGGIALVDTAGLGTWEYSFDGTTFTPVGAVSESSALLLANDAILRYTPNSQNGETASITYRAWDTTGGANDLRVDLSQEDAVGGATAYSATVDTATLDVADVNDAPVLAAANPSLGTIATSGAATIDLTEFVNHGADTTTVTDVDQYDVLGGIALIGITGNGTWEYSLDGATFNLVDAVAEDSALLLPTGAALRYTPNGTDSEMASISYRAWDASAGEAGTPADATANGGDTAFSAALDTASLVVNDAPVLTPATPRLGTTDENTTFTLAAFINAGDGTTTVSDVNGDATAGGIVLVGVTGRGTWEYSLDGTTFSPVGNVSETLGVLLPSNTVLRYNPDGQNGETATITYRAWDATSGQSGTLADATDNGGAAAFSADADTASLTVTDVNDAPVLTPAEPSLGSNNFNTTTTTGLATFINDGSGTTGIVDVDDGAAVGGIAVLGTTGYGTWQYTSDGENFVDLGTVSESEALLLAADARLRYVPDGSHVETPTISYVAWDATLGQGGAAADATVRGNESAFSTEIDTASLDITNPNHAPVLTPATPVVGGDPRLGRTTPSIPKTISLTFFLDDTISDADSDAVVGGIALTAVTGRGAWEYSLDGTTFNAVGAVSESSALLLPKDAVLRYTPDGTTEETPSITYRAWDATAGSPGEMLDTSTNGDTTPFSIALDSAALLVRSTSISGLVYVDANNDGNCLTSSGARTSSCRVSLSNCLPRTPAALGPRWPASRRS